MRALVIVICGGLEQPGPCGQAAGRRYREGHVA